MLHHTTLTSLLPADIIHLDVGAKGGTRDLHALAPRTIVHAFEPHPAEAAQLHADDQMRRSFSQYEIHTVALSDHNGTAPLHLMHNSSMSSLLEPDVTTHRLHFGMMDGFPEWKHGLEIQRTVQVDVRTLDAFAQEHNIAAIDYLKLDTQGTELRILNGAASLLDRHAIHVIKAEVAFVPVYKEQCVFSDVDAMLRRHHMRFVDCRFDASILYERSHRHNDELLHDAPRYGAGGDAVYVVDIDHVPDERKVLTATSAALILAELGYKSIAFDLLHRHAALDEIAAIQLVRKVAAKDARHRLKQTIKHWCPPGVWYWLHHRRKHS